MIRRMGRLAYLAGALILFGACFWLWADRHVTEVRLRDNDARDRRSVADRAELHRQIDEGRAQREAIKLDQAAIRDAMAGFVRQSARRHDQTQALIREVLRRLPKGDGEARP